MEHLTRQTAAV